MERARVYETTVEIPTYLTAEAEPCPIFMEKRTYQGSSGKVYPLPVTEKLLDRKTVRPYRALFLENEYLSVMVLPELGGRIQRAYDKTNGYDFVYYNQVIKPALVGLAGPWISGGIEFNWPQHHRPSTFSPVDSDYSENEDGSASVFVGETDVMYGTKGMAIITLYPGKAYIEIKGQLYNPTDLPQSFLWWANPAVAVNDSTFSVFPPDVNAVMDHGKRAVSTFPIATGEYYKYDYSEGVDISRYKNIKVPTSYMAAHSEFDFIGNFDESADAGLLHVADHHVSPGKKQWTWGCGDFGKMWDKNLTDEDGPYIELMTGVFTDNQPDFTWLRPQEEKTFVQYFMPYKTVGRVSNATRDAVVGVAGERLKVYVTGNYPGAVITARAHGEEIYRRVADLSPKQCFVERVEGLDDYEIEVRDAAGKLLCRCTEYQRTPQPLPEPARKPGKPEEVGSLEELYLIGQHLEQYRHATYDPAAYYLEGLKRDASDIRLNRAYGLLLFRKGRLAESVPYFERAIRSQTRHNPNPYLGECRYDLGLALSLLGRKEQARDAFYKATWGGEVQSAAFYHLACLSVQCGDDEEALAFTDRALSGNYHSMKVRVLKGELLARLGRERERAEFLEESRQIDRLCLGILFQLPDREAFRRVMGGREFNYRRLAFDYFQFGLYDKAAEVLELCPDGGPLLWYSKGYAYAMQGRTDEARRCCEMAETLPWAYCFPNTTEEMLVLEWAASVLEHAPMARYYLGNLYYDRQRYKEAIGAWEETQRLLPDFAPALRNLSIAYYNKTGEPQKALARIRRAFELAPDNSRFLLEQVQLMEKNGISAAERLALLKAHPALVEDRDALCVEYLALLNAEGENEEALRLVCAHTFHPWEGGEGRVAEQYKAALFALAERSMEEGRYEEAEEYAARTLTYPDNLGEGKLPNVPDNRAHYLMAKCEEALGRRDEAKEQFELACAGEQIPSAVRYYNDQPSDYMYYQGLAFLELGNLTAAKRSFHQLLMFGERHSFDKVEDDFFAVSLPELTVYREDIQARSDDYCRRLQMLGQKGLEEIARRLRESGEKEDRT